MDESYTRYINIIIVRSTLYKYYIKTLRHELDVQGGI